MPSFPEFALDRELPACVITRELAHLIEKQLLCAEWGLLGESQEAHQCRLDISVVDAYGGETFRSATDIPTAGFPETTGLVRFVLESPIDVTAGDHERSLRVKLAFRSEHGNRLQVRLKGPQARERVIGLYERICQLVESKSLDNWLFRRRDWVIVPAGFGAVIGGLIWLAQTHELLASKIQERQIGSYWILTAAVLTMTAYIAIIHWFFPPCAFETSRWSRIEQWRSFAVQGFAGLVVFDGIVYALAQRVFTSIGVVITQ